MAAPRRNAQARTVVVILKQRSLLLERHAQNLGDFLTLSEICFTPPDTRGFDAPTGALTFLSERQL